MGRAGGRSRQLAAVLGSWSARGLIVGGVVLLAEGGRITSAATCGWADRERRLPMRRETVLRYASMSKLITSAAAMALCDRGLLDRAHPVAIWLPWFRPGMPNGDRPDISLTHLLSHTAGLSYGFEQPPGNAYERAGISDGLDGAAVPLAENLARLAGLPLHFAPGSGWQYSLATDVVGAVIERACGEPLAQAINCLVTAPLRMRSAAFASDAGGRLAPAYWASDGEVRRIIGTGWYPVEGGRCHISEGRQSGAGYLSAGTGMTGTADDYMRLLLCLRGGGAPILSPDSTRAMLSGAIGSVPIASRGPGWTFGLGPMILADPRVAGIRQGRGTWGWCGVHGGHYWVDPENDLTFVALTNTGVTGAWGAFADELREVIYD